ncbi:hypothetical protein AB0C02_10605 [Micromonospora sp. NPDC048999]
MDARADPGGPHAPARPPGLVDASAGVAGERGPLVTGEEARAIAIRMR